MLSDVEPSYREIFLAALAQLARRVSQIVSFSHTHKRTYGDFPLVCGPVQAQRFPAAAAGF